MIIGPASSSRVRKQDEGKSTVCDVPYYLLTINTNTVDRPAPQDPLLPFSLFFFLSFSHNTTQHIRYPSTHQRPHHRCISPSPQSPSRPASLCLPKSRPSLAPPSEGLPRAHFLHRTCPPTIAPADHSTTTTTTPSSFASSTWHVRRYYYRPRSQSSRCRWYCRCSPYPRG